jgi:predicted Zn-dependent protease
MHRRTFLCTLPSATLPTRLVRRTPGLMPVSLPAGAPRAPTPLITLNDPQVRVLAQTAVDAAHAAGATYADVRLTLTTSRNVPSLLETVTLGMSVRALRNGYWGWAATPYLAATEASRVGRQAVRLAIANAASGLPRTVDWRPIPVVRGGSWTTPIAIDPFAVALEEIFDWCAGVSTFTSTFGDARGGQSIKNAIQLTFTKQERLFASTEGSDWHQQV